MTNPAIPRNSLGPATLTVALLVVALLIAWPDLAASPLISDDVNAMQRILFYDATLPRMATALIAGAALSLSGALFQQVLRNPLASPTTLGVAAGASLALALATLYAPMLMAFGGDLVALAGSAIAGSLVFLLGARKGFSPFTLVLSGMVISLWCGALSAILVLLNDRYLVSLFIWGSGSLSQNSWQVPVALLPKVLVLATLGFLLARPLALLELGDEGARALGLKLAWLRAAALAIAVALSALVTSAVGVIGFIGLVAPILARLTGARRPVSFFIWSSLIGAALLFVADEAVKMLAGASENFLPTGAVMAVLGSPLLLVLLPRLKTRHRMLPSAPAAPAIRVPVSVVAIALLVVVALALVLGRDAEASWSLAGFGDLQALLPFRLPRVLAALAAGAMLAVSGVILQRLTGNEMASPEVLGISAGATLGMAVALYWVMEPSLAVQITAASIGAGIVLAAIVVLGLRSQFAPERVLLAGIALGALADAIVGFITASGDPRALFLIRWMSGSTYMVSLQTALSLLGVGALLIAVALCLRRWLDLLPLGPSAAAALGISLGRTRFALYGVAALLTAAATLAVGPLSFVGLMAPHLARELGLRRALPHMAGAACLGGGLMVLADWLGRMLIFPYQIPAGLLCALLGAPFLILLLGRRT
ncbi:Fe(3+)-hydroxamate ABC transporter permease FhuB [Rhizobium sp.]